MNYRKLVLKVLVILILTNSSIHYSYTRQTKSLSQDKSATVENYKASAEKLLKEGNKNEATGFYNKIAYLYWENNIYDEAVSNFITSLELNKELGNKNAIASINSNIGMIYSDKSQFDHAIPYFQAALKARQQFSGKKEIANAHINLANAYSGANKNDLAIAETEKALTIASELNDKQLLRSVYLTLSEKYEKIGNAEKSLTYFNYYSSFEKVLQKEVMAEETQKNQAQLSAMELRTKMAEADKKLKEEELQTKDGLLQHVEGIAKEREEEISVLNQKKKIQELVIRQNEAKLEKEELLRNSIIVGLSLVVLIAVLLLMGLMINRRAKMKLATQNTAIFKQQEVLAFQKKELEAALQEIKHQTSKITSSINYAKRIQEAILPDQNNIKSHLPESFILYKPKDIVSGDFYWFKHVEGYQDEFFDIKEKVLISAVDCTGHGVPGAFMSMIGSELLNKIVNLKGVISPEKILSELHKEVRIALKQDVSDNKDGMDMAICLIHKTENRLDFAGAKNPMFYVKNGELCELSASRHSIGGSKSDNNKPFQGQSIIIDAPITCYIFSDGFVDQFGGIEGKKFMSKNFKTLLLQIHEKPLSEQRDLLEKAIEDWKGNMHKQIDDILVIGFRLYPIA